MPTTIDRAAEFIWRNARLLERQVFGHLFLGRSRDAALAALLIYQNDDGGFGNALEPDKRSPDGQPIDQEIALRVMLDIGGDDVAIQRMCAFLMTISTADGGLPVVLRSVGDYPHAPWWIAPVDDDPPASLNPTASIAGLLYAMGVRHAWLDRATAYCWTALEVGPTLEVHEALAVALFLEHVPDRDRAAHTFAPLAKRLRDGELVAFDPDAAGYVKKPLDWAPTPTSLCRSLFTDDVLDTHLDRLQADQAADGGWPITWPALSPAVEAEYRGWVTVQALKTLRAYGREA